MTRNAAPALDAIVLDVFWNRLISICNEQATALMRTSFTTSSASPRDLSAGVFDPAGQHDRAVGHRDAWPHQLDGDIDASLPGAVSLHALEPGDVLITNDPWFTSGQLHDLTIMTPVFSRPAGRRLFRQHLPRRGHWRPRPVGRRARDLRGRVVPAHPEALSRRRAERRRIADRARQRAIARDGPRRHSCARFRVTRWAAGGSSNSWMNSGSTQSSRWRRRS